jgi:hypothetical protein
MAPGEGEVSMDMDSWIRLLPDAEREALRLLLKQLGIAVANKLLTLELKAAAERDALTGTFNRGHLENELTEAQKERLAEIQTRVDEIKAMDFSDMSKDEIKDVRMELKDMKEEAKRASGGVYISVGAIIIILLLLILLT